MERFSEDDQSHQILASKDPAGSTLHLGGPRASWILHLGNYIEGCSRALRRDKPYGVEEKGRRGEVPPRHVLP